MHRAFKLKTTALIAAAALLVACAAKTDQPRQTKAAMLAEFNLALEAAQSTSGPGMPVLWTLADEDTTIHMFGTVHLLRPGMDWRSEAFNVAFASADKVVFEVDMKSEAGQRALMKDFVARGFYTDGRTLRAALDDETEKVVEAALDSVGLPMDAVNAMEPWMTAANLGVMKLQKDGYDPNSGVDNVLEAEAKAAGKSFGFLEEARDQADAFDLLPEDVQIEFLYETAVLLDESPRMLDLLVEEWADGDVVGLGVIVADPDTAGMGGDAVYNSLLVNRNRNWVPRIEAMLEEPGIVFIAVGAAHLAGPDSVITMLRDKGYEVTGP